MPEKKPVRKAKKIEEKQAIPELRPGDSVKVHSKFREGDKERVQIFIGTIIQTKGRGDSKTFTVRKVARGIGVERIFPLASPMIVKVEVKRHSKVRRAKLYYLRGKRGKDTRLRQQEESETPARPEAVAAQ